MTKHYHVLLGLRGGYIPNTNEVYATKRDAQNGAAWLAEHCRDQDVKVTGSARNGWYEVGEYEYIEVTSPCYADCDPDAEY